jgi:uncharacterized protein YndB with AHSA1/START domain
MRLQKSIEIAAPPEKIWPFLVEPEKILKWCITFQKFEYTGEQRGGVGTPIYIEEKAGPTPLMKLNFAVTEWVENERIAFKLTSGTGVKGYELSETIEATKDGSKFTLTENVEMPWGIVGKLLESVGRGTAEGHFREYLAKLKSLAEA